VADPLSARGIVLLGEADPIVLCAVDWVGIGNDGNKVWRHSLADAADTTVAIDVDGEVYELEIADIERARLVPEL